MNELSFRRALCDTLGITALVGLPAASAATPPTPEALFAQVADLSARIKALESALARLKAATPSPVTASATNTNVDARVRVIERRLEVNAEEAAASRAKVPAVSVSEKGLAVTSPDGNYELKLCGYIQTDARFLLDDESQSTADSFLMRRVRPISEGTVAKQFYYRVMPDFAGASVTLQDAYAGWRQYPLAKVAVGKMKKPLGLESLASGSDLPFVERGITNNLVPNRDIGLQVSGELLNGKLSYQTGVFDGDPDGENVAALDSRDDKDFAGRIIMQPFLDAYGPLQGLGFGISGTYGSELGAANSPNLGAYRTPAQVRFLKYRATSSAVMVVDVKGKETSITLSPSLETTAVADGDRYRFSPQGFFYWRQFGLFGDYVESTQSVSFADHNAPVTNAAWQVSAFLVLTGEDAKATLTTTRPDSTAVVAARSAHRLIGIPNARC